MEVCPFSAAALDEDGLSMICDLCDGNPECVAVCPVQAIEYQDITETEQKKRIITAERHSDNVLKKWRIR